MRSLSNSLILGIAVMMIIVTFSPLMFQSEDPIDDRIDLSNNEVIVEDVFAPEDHSNFDGSTSWNYKLTSKMDIDASTNIELVNGEIRPLFNDTLISPVLKSVNVNLEHVQGYGGGRVYVAVYGDTIFWAYYWKNGSNFQASMIASYDNGNTWTTPVDVYTGSTYGMRVGIYIWKGSLYYFINDIPSSILTRRLYVKEAPISTWTNIRTASTTTILNNRALDFDLCSDNNYIYLSTVRTSELEGWFYYYDGSSWSSGVKVVDRGYCTRSSVEVQQVGSDTRVLYFYARHWESGAFADGDLHMKYSTNLGTSWSSEIQVMDDDNSYYQPTTENVNGTLIAFANHVDRDDVTISRSLDGGSTWSNEVDIVTMRGANTLHGNTYGFTSNFVRDEDRLYVAYETANNVINLTYSDDYGANWVSEASGSIIQAEATNSFDPRLPTNAKAITYMFDKTTNQDLKFRWLQSYEPTSTVTLTECSPPMLGSWNSIGFDVSIPARTYVHYRVLDGTDDSVLQGWTNLSSKTSGQINAMSFNKTDTFTGPWASSSLAGSIKVEVRLTSLGMMHPSLWQVHVDYSTSRNYDEGFDNLLGIDEYDCSWEPGWMNFSGRGRSEYITTEPIELEDTDSWPDTLLMQIDNVDSSNFIQVGIIDVSTDQYVTGFTTKDADQMNIPTSELATIPGWNGKYLGDLPGKVRAIKLDIMIQSNPNNQPPTSIDRIWMADNLPPEVIGIDAEPDWSLYRTEWVELSVWVDDDIEMPVELDCQLYYRKPGSVMWDRSLLSKVGAVGSLHYWNLSIPRDEPTGEWEIMANVTDHFGAFSGETSASNTLLVINNRPTPPKIELTPEMPLTVDDLTVTLTSPGTDVELYEEELTYKFEWFVNSVLFRTDENITEYSSMISADETNKGNEWMVKVYTYDGIEFSDPEMSSVVVENTEPFVNGTFGPYHFDEDVGTAVIDMHPMFTDNDEDGLEFIVLMDVPYFFEIITGDILNIQIPADWYGKFEVNVSVNDGDLSNQTFFEVIIDPVNDLPILNETEILTVNEDEWLNTTFTGYDPADMDDITFSIESYENIPGLVEGENFFFYPNGSFNFLPNNGMVGEHIFNLTIDDDNGGVVWMDVTIIVVNTNDPPTGSMNLPTENLTIEVGQNVTFNATGMDIDGDDLEISWIIKQNLTGGITEIGEEITYTFDTEGIFYVSCFVSDGGSGVKLGSIKISVFTPIPENTPPYGLIPVAIPDITQLALFYGMDVQTGWAANREIPTDVPLKLSTVAYDDDGDILTYTWTIVEDPNWIMTGAEIVVPANNLTVGTHTFKITVDDGNDHSIEQTLDPIKVIKSGNSDLEDITEDLAWMLMCSIITPVVILLLGIGVLIFFIIRRKRKGDDAVKEMPKSDIVEVFPPTGMVQTEISGGVMTQQQAPITQGIPAPQQSAPLPPQVQQQGLPQAQPEQLAAPQYPQQVAPQGSQIPPVQPPAQQYQQPMQPLQPQTSPVQPPMEQYPPQMVPQEPQIPQVQQQPMAPAPDPMQQYPPQMAQAPPQTPVQPVQQQIPAPQPQVPPVQQLPLPPEETI